MPSVGKIVGLVVRDFIESFQPQPEKHLVGFVSGIRTNANWVDEANSAFDWAGEAFECRKLNPNENISSFNLVTRLGMTKRCDEIRRQIQSIIDERGNQKVSLVCHSLGCDIVTRVLATDINFRFESIIFLGSVVHKQHAERIKYKCNKFYNFRGTRDQWPLVAALIRPRLYGPTGNFGFSHASCHDLVFDCNHQDCTQVRHVLDCVLPLLRGVEPEIPAKVTYYFDENNFRYASAVFYVSFLILGAAIICFIFNLHKYLSLSIFLFGLCLSVSIFSFYAVKKRARAEDRNQIENAAD